jgi:hypothetical protein
MAGWWTKEVAACSRSIEDKRLEKDFIIMVILHGKG